MDKLRLATLAVAPLTALCLAAAPASAVPTLPRAEVTADVQTPVLYDSDEGGLRVYGLSGNLVQSLAADAFPNDGRYNNVDIAWGVQLGDRTVDLALVSDRYNDTIRFFTIDPAGSAPSTPLAEVTSAAYDWLFVASDEELADEHTAYGLAVWQPSLGGTFAVATQEARTTLAIAEIKPQANGTVGYEVVREIVMPASFPLADGTTWTPCDEPGVDPQFEGVTVDQANGVLSAAQEDVGLWRIDLVGKKAPVLIDKVTDFGIHDAYDEETEECEPLPGQPSEDANPFGGTITADAEGVDLYYGQGNTGYIILSSQGSDEFFVYARQGNNKLVGSFTVGEGNGFDAVHGSDGLAVTNRPVGDFRQGLLVTHDEPHTGAGVDEDQDPTNFHFVDWAQIADGLGLTLNKAGLKASNDPRFR